MTLNRKVFFLALLMALLVVPALAVQAESESVVNGGVTPTPSSTPSLVATAAAASDNTINYGQSVQGTLASTDKNVAYIFDGHAGDTVTITLSSSDFDAYLSLEDSSGKELTNDDDSAGDLNAQIVFTLPADGTYTIKAGSSFGGVSGAFTLALAEGEATPEATMQATTEATTQPTPEVTAQATEQSTQEPTTQPTAEATSASGASSINGTLTDDQLSAVYSFDGHAGDNVSFTLTSTDFDSYLILQDASGKSLIEDDDSAGNLNARIADFSLPADGTYTLIASSNTRASTGSFTLEVSGASLQPTSVATAVPTAVVQTGGSIQVGTPVNGSLTKDQSTASYTFTTTGADTVTITLTSDDFDAYLSLQDASGKELANDDDSAGNLNAQISNFTLPGSGTYTVVASSAGGLSVGSFTLSVTSASGTQPTAEPTSQPTAEPTSLPSDSAITVGQSVSGSLSGDQSSATYTFDGQSNQTVTIELDSNDFDPYVVLKDSSGTTLASDDDSAGNLNALINAFTLPSDDTYTIVVGSFDDSGRGSYTLSLNAGGTIEPTPEPTSEPTSLPSGSQINIGSTVTGNLTTVQPTAAYTFEGEAGQTVQISLNSSDFDSFLRLQDANGIDLTTDDDSGGDLNARIGAYTLPNNGTYTISVESLDDNYGAYTLSLSTVQSQTIEYGQTVNGTLANGTDTATYHFQGTEGDTVTISATSSTFDTYLTLSDDTGSSLATNDDGGGSGTDSFVGPYTLTSDGNYTITLSSYDSEETGAYSITLNHATLTAIAYGDTKDESFTADTSAFYYSFEGKAGDVVNVTVDSGGSIDTSLLMSDPDGYQVAFDNDGGPGFDPEIYRQVLTLDGTYTLVLQAAVPGETGDVHLTLAQGEVKSLDNGPQVIHLSSTQTEDVVSFTGHAGESVSLSATAVGVGGGVSPYLTVTQNGNDVASGSGTTISGLTLQFVVPADGPVTVQVADDSGNTVSIQVSVESQST